MKRWSLEDLVPRNPTLDREGSGADSRSSPPRGLILTCTAECFPPDLLAAQLNSDAWMIHRTPANVFPPYGTDTQPEDGLIEHAISVLKVQQIVVCAHSNCALADHLRTPDQPATDFLLQHWLSHAEAARRALAGIPLANTRTAAERNGLAQVANLGTHPAVAVGVAQGRLLVGAWLYDAVSDELLYPPPGDTAFSRLVALSPRQNAGLRPEVIRRPRPRSLPRVLDPRRLDWS